MTNPPSFFRGRELVPSLSTEDQLKKLGMSEKDIEHIQTQAYSVHCCDAFADVNYVRPVIDYGTSRIEYYEASMPYLDEDAEGSRISHKWEQWHFCPFCGKALSRTIPSDRQSTLDC